MTGVNNMTKHMDYMKLAMESAKEGYRNGEGGPFGAVVVKDGEILAVAHNCVIKNNDPTAHAEMQAIRMACEKIGSHSLKGAVIYATGEPCPMCLSAIVWANMKECYYANTVQDADRIGFRDDKIYRYFRGETEILTKTHLPDDECLAMYDEYKQLKSEKY